jgi:hypothetical protein
MVGTQEKLISYSEELATEFHRKNTEDNSVILIGHRADWWRRS